MSWISYLSYKSWRNVHLAVIVLLGIFFISGQADVNLRVCQIALDGFYYPFFKIKSSVVELATVSAENHRLRDSLLKISVKLSLYEEAARENVRLRSALGFEPPAGYRLLPARVVSVTGDQLPVSATINRGMADSIRIDQPVINQSGLVGRVEEVLPGYAKVQMLTDPRNRVAARVAASREMGVVRYLPSEGLILADFPNQGVILEGDIILSSGLGGVYPVGLKLGTVTRVVRPENKPFCEVSLALAANFHSIEELFVLMPEGQ